MNTHPFHLLVPALAAAVLLSACGGGADDDVKDKGSPQPTAQSASLAVTGSTDSALNGVYVSTGISLNKVTKFNPVGGDPETCRFDFTGLRQAVTDRQITGGDIRYIPGTNTLRDTFMKVGTVEFHLVGTANAVVDRTSNEIDYTGAVLTATDGSNATITIRGSIPMLGDRPEGC